MDTHALRMLFVLALAFGLAGATTHPQAPVPVGTAQVVEAIQAYNGVSIVAGTDHTCLLTATGGVKCWGSNEYGQVGDGTTLFRSSPTDVAGLADGVTALAAGERYTCALKAGGEVMCWGYNDFGQLGDGTYINRYTPVEVIGLGSPAVGLGAGFLHTCAALQDGEVKCWGNNLFGQLGNGSNQSSPTPVRVVSLPGQAIAVGAGAWHTCALTVYNGVWCWGFGDSGQLGNGVSIISNVPVQVAVLESGTVALAVGSYHSCALTDPGQVWCWGDNSAGQIGNGSYQAALIPTLVEALTGVTGVAAGEGHTCAITANGSAKCWGANQYGQLGNGNRFTSNKPVDVVGLSGQVSALAAGRLHTCALLALGGLFCWGNNQSGQLGLGVAINYLVPTDVTGLPPEVTAISSHGSHTCAALESGQARCWGSNRQGQLGDGTTQDHSTPVEVIQLSDVVSLAAGSRHTCALTSEGGVKCWGDNDYGQLGDATTTSQYAPVDVAGLGSGVTALASGYAHTCALTDDGGVKCWGDNYYGQVGDDSGKPYRQTPEDVVGLPESVAALAAGGFHTCALTESGGVYCWGNNMAGQLGDGSGMDQQPVPVAVQGLSSDVASLAAGWTHTCAGMSDGSAKCWGYNDYGQLGDGTIDLHDTPVDVTGLGGGVLALTAGINHTCAILDGGRVQCWGEDSYGQLGDGGNASQYTPVDVAGLFSSVIAVTAGASHTCAVHTSGRIKCWGNNRIGQIGQPFAFDYLIPTSVPILAPTRLKLNYLTGQPGSIFALTGEGFPPGAQATVSVNGTVLSETLPVLPGGGFIFFLDTAGAEAGFYQVTVSANPSAWALLRLDPESGLHPLEGGGTTLSLPAGIAWLGDLFYFPLAGR